MSTPYARQQSDAWIQSFLMPAQHALPGTRTAGMQIHTVPPAPHEMSDLSPLLSPNKKP